MPDALPSQPAWAARTLRRGKPIWHLMFGFLAGAAAFLPDDRLPTATRAGFALSLAAGLVAATYALRLRFDIGVFERWAASSDLDASMHAFDARLQLWMPWRRAAPRSLSDRIAGAERLRRRRNVWFGLQVLAWVLGMLPLALR